MEMKGRKAKPLEQKMREGSRVRADRINRDAPVPPAGDLTPPEILTPEEVKVWNSTLANSAPGQIKPLDRALLHRYCWLQAGILEAFEEWEGERKQLGLSRFLKMGQNLVLGAHPLLGVIQNLMKQIAVCESKLGLSPVDREHIRASLQGEMFHPNDPWEEFEGASETTQ
jgi:phage terminase small subunit